MIRHDYVTLSAKTLILITPRDRYLHVWGATFSNVLPTTSTWQLFVCDITSKPTTLSLYLFHGDSPLIIFIDLNKYMNTFNLHKLRIFEFSRPTDTKNRMFYTYIAADEDRNRRLRFESMPQSRSTTTTLLENISKIYELNQATKIHRFSYSTAEEMKRLLADLNMDYEQTQSSCEKLYES